MSTAKMRSSIRFIQNHPFPILAVDIFNHISKLSFFFFFFFLSIYPSLLLFPYHIIKTTKLSSISPQMLSLCIWYLSFFFSL
eukprot:UN10943